MRRSSASAALVATLGTLLAACGGDCGIASCPAVSELTVSPKSVTITVGQNVTLTPAAKTAKSDIAVQYSFTSAAPTIATVSASGVVTGVAEGSTTITIEATGSGSGYETTTKTASATITVTPLPDALRSVSLSGGTVNALRTLQLAPVPDLATANVTVTYQFATSSASIATVDPNGVVTGVSAGTATITVTATGRRAGYTTNNKIAAATISVTPAVEALQAFTVTPTNTSLTVGQLQSLVPTVNKAGTDVTVTYRYETNAPAIATVSADGAITGVGAGTATITVTATGRGTGYATTDKIATVFVSVSALPDALLGLSVVPTNGSVLAGQSLALMPSAVKANANITVSYQYQSSANSIATVSTTGVVSGVAPGTVNITVLATGNGSGYAMNTKTATATITVTAKPNALLGVTLFPQSSSLTAGQTLAMSPTVEASGLGVNVTYAYASTANSIATVNGAGVVTGVAPGTATITVVATGSGTAYTTNTVVATATINVTVMPNALVDLAFAAGNSAVVVGQALQLIPIATKANANVSIDYTYQSGATSVATVDNFGVVRGISPGAAIISVTATGRGTGFATNSISATVTISVSQMPDALTSLALSPSIATMTMGQTLALVPTPTKAASSVNVTYGFASNATSVATVSPIGIVTALAPGTAIITATATGSGTGYTTSSRMATATVTVAGPSSGLGVGFGLEQFSSIPAGTFSRGSADYFNEQPVRLISISAFRMQKTEVTQSQWRQVMTGTAMANPSAYSGCDLCPVENVSFEDVQLFLTRLNALIDQGKGYRLPTEAEWEYAARATTTGDFGGTGDVLTMGWIQDNAFDHPRAVAGKTANLWDLFDMHGNIGEWVNDWFEQSYYAGSPSTNPQGPASGVLRVWRGGTFMGAAALARSASRSAAIPSGRGLGVGFRLARNP
jgi:uncharacterized protein YjdB